MSDNGSLPSYDKLFGEPSAGAGDDARSVHSPAAYLADLLQLLDDRFERSALAEARPQITEVPLDATNTFTEVPYLDIVNEVLAAQLDLEPGDDTDAALTSMTTLSAPVALPVSLADRRRRAYLRLAGVAPEQLYRRFTPERDPDVVAREFLGLTRETVDLVTTPAATESDVKTLYRLDKAGFDTLKPVDRFLAATGLTAPELAELLFGRLSATAVGDRGLTERTRATALFVHQGGPPVTVDADEGALVWEGGRGFEPWRWFERVHRFVRLARGTGMPLTDLDLVLRSLCGNVLDRAAVRTLAVVRHLAVTLDLPVDVVCSLVAPVDTLGIGDGDAPADLFDRTFNGRAAEVETAVVRGSGFVARAHRHHRALTCTGDLLAPRNADFRRRIVRALGLSETVLAEIVRRFRRQYRTLRRTGPFDGDETGVAALSLLHRVARLTDALGLAPAELFAVLDVLGVDPSIRGYNPFDLLIDAPAREPDCFRILAEGTVADGLWLVQTVVAVVRWMQDSDLGAEELIEIVGGAAAPPPDDDRRAAALAVLDGLHQQFRPVLLTPDVFVSERFGPRSARVVHDGLLAGGGPVSARDPRLVRVTDPAAASSAAHACLLRLPVIEEHDFVGLGLAGHVQQKIFTNLVLRGYLDGDGRVVEDAVGATADGFRLAGDFEAVRAPLFALIGALCAEADEDDGEDPAAPAVAPSDLEVLDGLTPDELAELYDNLIFNRYLGADGTVLWPELFGDPANTAEFWLDADVAGIAPAVWERLRDRVNRFDATPLAVDPAIFAHLRLRRDGVTRLLENLRVNGHLDADDQYVDKRGLLALPRDGLDLALEFYPHRRAILDAIRAQVDAHRDALLATTPDDLGDLADAALATRIVAGLDGTYLTERRVRPDQLVYLRDGGGVLGLWLDLDPAAEATICTRLAAVIVEQQPYHLDRAALADLDLADDEVDLLVAALSLAGDLTADLTLPEDRIAYFLDVQHALEYTVAGFTDEAVDVFFLLNAVAQELTDATAEIVDRLEAHAATQRHTFVAALADGLGVASDVVEAACRALCGDLDRALDDLLVPVLVAGAESGQVTVEPTDRRFRLLHGRLVRFALLAAKLGLDGVETEVAFRDQDLVGKFPERLALPPGLTRLDALLPGSDGRILLFDHDTYWSYSAVTYELADRTALPLRALSPQFADLTGIDAAFVDAQGDDWLVGRDRLGRSRTFRREAGSARWVPTPRTWGAIKNNFADPARIDTAFRDADGKTYLFAGDQYVRYSADDQAEVDQGYPKTIAGNWPAEGLHSALPPGFEASVDASFHGLDGRTYLFKDGRYAVSGDPATQPVAQRWGQVRNAFAGAERVDAAYTEGAGLYLLVGGQIVRYADCLENGDVRVDEGYPRRLEQHFPDLPAEFESGIEAAFAEPGPDGQGSRVHLFKDGREVAPAPGDRILRRVDKRWGQLGPVLAEGTVDAAFVGLDGRTYLFSGDRYVRYTGADYSHVDAGYPRRLAGDWAGMTRVDAAFVLDGRTHLFGTAERLFEIPLTDEFERAAHERVLDAGDVPPELRDRLLTHGLAPVEGRRVEGHVETGAREWTVPLDDGFSVVVRVVDAGMTVSVAAGTTTQFCVRYSGRSYTRPDPGYPRPLTDDWWNLPERPAGDPVGFTRVDAVFTGRDERTYLFAGDRFVVFDNRHRWWSEPRSLLDDWDSIPFDHVDAAFVGNDGRTYVFGGTKYVRFSGDDYTRADDRYPKTTTSFWGVVVNPITRSGHVDAALVVQSPPVVEGGAERRHTYLFSGRQYVRYEGTDYANVDDGYPRDVATSLHTEPRFTNLAVTLDSGVDAAVADRRSVYLFTGTRCHVVSSALYRSYDHLGLTRAGCAFLEDGGVVVEDATGWHRYSALEGEVVERTEVRPRAPRSAPARFRRDLDAVLHGVDGNTYLFQGRTCYDVALGREFPAAEDWGRPRNTVADGEGVDAAFVGRDGRTYVFAGDQFVTYAGAAYAGADVEGLPRPVAEHWGGLTSVRLTYVLQGVTHLFEPPDAAGNRRYVVYSGTDYTRPDPGYPKVAGPDFWEVPAQYRGAGEFPVAVLFDRDNTLYLTGTEYVARNAASGSLSYPRPLARLWPGLPLGTASAPVRTAFTGADGATYFFSRDDVTRFANEQFSVPQPVRAGWGRIRNNFTSATRATAVDAAFVWRGTTYLFSGDQYVRYSGPGYRHVDVGYPKSVVDDLRDEECFRNLPEAFEQALADRVAAGEQTVIDAVLANQRTVHLFVGPTLHVVSQSLEATYDLSGLGRVRNNLADTGRVDASFVTGEQTFLFSGDQYVRYSGAEYAFVDEGYPRTIASSLPGEVGATALPEQFHDGLDAALAGPDGPVHLFRGRQFVRCVPGSATPGTPDPRPVVQRWGRVRNRFTADPYTTAVDAAFVDGAGRLFAFRGDQYLRYRTPAAELADDGYPRAIKDDWGNLPTDFEAGLDAAFVLDGATYLVRGDQHVRYSGGDLRRVDRTYPQPLVRRWGPWADYRLADLRAVARFRQLQARTGDGRGGLAAVLSSATVTDDPYARVAALFGWTADELMWVKRHNAFLPAAPGYETELDLEIVDAAADLFALCARLGGVPSTVFATVWTPLHGATRGTPAAGTPTSGTPAARPTDGRAVAADGLRRLLALRHAEADWAVAEKRLHDELNEAARDALVAAVLAPSGGLRTSRDLFDELFIDVDMGSAATTSRVREGIAAAQLFLHRYFLDLQPVTLRAPDGDTAPRPEAVKAELRRWWTWMKNYRVWEANRKVYLYPENYLRPELRDTKTPAFAALEDDLRQGEITQASAERAYKRYLDEYTEVSRLTIAGGYVHEPADDDELPSHLVLFGRTKTDPRRYYYRRAEFSREASRSAQWHPWLKVDVQIDSDRVYPVFAFDRVFVFWAAVEDVADATPTVSFTDSTDAGTRSLTGGSHTTHIIKIYYSFYNLNKEWVPAQVLGTDRPIQDSRPISDVRLLVERALVPPASAIGNGAARETIVVRCSYAVYVDATTTQRRTLAVALTPELYTNPAVPVSFDDSGTERFAAIFDEPVGRGLAPVLAIAAPVAGRAAVAAPVAGAPTVAGATVAEIAIAAAQAHNAVVAEIVEVITTVARGGEPAGGTAAVPGSTAPDSTAAAAPTVVMFNKPSESSDGPWFSFDYKGGSFLCKPAPLPPVQDAPLPVSGDGEQLPSWERFQTAFTAPGGSTWFFDAAGEYVEVDPRSGPGGPRPVAARFGRERNALTEGGVVDAVVARNGVVYVLTGRRYVRYSDGAFGVPDPGYPRDIESNTDGLPRWSRIDAAFTAPGGTTYYFSDERGFVTSPPVSTPTSPPISGAQAVRDVFGKLAPAEREAREREARDREAREREVRDRLLREIREIKDPREREAREREVRERENQERAARERDARERDAGFFVDQVVDRAVVRDGRTFLIAGDRYVRYSAEPYQFVDVGYPRPLAGNPDGLPPGDVVVHVDGSTTHSFDNTARTWTRLRDGATQTVPTGDLARGSFARNGGIDAACVRGQQLFLVAGDRFVRYTLAGGVVPDFVDPGYPKPCAVAVDALVEIGRRIHVFSADRSGPLAANRELDSPVELRPIQGNWGNLPHRFRAGLDAAGATAAALYLFRGDRYVRYPKTASSGVPVSLPYELTAAEYEIVRLTTGTAVTLNQRLLAGGVPAVLAVETQETDETPGFDKERSADLVIKVRRERVDDAHLPVSSHLDFDSANGIYYWEIFFHAPLLIAQALNAGQRFAEAMQWYEFVFDPTRARDSWRFLPFRAVDVAALVDTCLETLGVLAPVVGNAGPTDLLGRVRTLAPVFGHDREARGAELAVLRGDLPRLVSMLTDHVAAVTRAVGRLNPVPAPVAGALGDLRETHAIIVRLGRRYDLMVGGVEAAVRRYLDDPFDPHAIAAMRPGAYRRAVVMGYIDNLLDWGDMLFRQYTAESIDEARMLYLLAHDLLGPRPRRLGSRPMPEAEYYGQLRHEPGEYDMLLRWAAPDGGAEAPHSSAAPPADGAYFVVPENAQLADYWTRVDDRLHKIRQSLDILGVARPLPLFEPPIDPAALVSATASGADLATAAASGAPAAVPHYRFAFVLRRAQDLVQKLGQLGGDLLNALDRRDAEELALLQSRHEGAILAMTRAIKTDQVGIARANLAELAESEAAARARETHYQQLLDEGMTPLEEAQVALMVAASIAHNAAAAIKLASGIAHAFPQSKIGLFIAGLETGGDQAGSSLDKFSEFSESLGEGLSVTGEVLGTFASHQRMAEDWRLQLSTARSDVAQIAQQTEAATRQLAVAERDLEILGKQIEQNESVTTFMKGRFANAELYSWMSGRLSGLYLQAYALAYEMARAAEQAFRFERGVDEAEASFVRPVYWESRRNGLLAGETLGLDLERMAQAYLSTDGRGLEITRSVSLAEVDPVALLRLKSAGTCEFTLSEALFDYDFPGHYRRQIRWLSVDFLDAGGQPVTPNAVLTQLGHKTVLQPDPAAVRYLLDPKGSVPAAVRTDWRAGQQVALSHAPQGEENNGLFRLNLDDDRYLPFEGTGAVSTWRLQLTGRRSDEDPGLLGDVVITVRYTADGGDPVFANAVKGMLKPYQTFRYLDVAAEFPDEWASFLDGDGDELVLPISPDMFPNMVGRQISAIYTRFDVEGGGGVRMVLNGDPDWTLEDGKVLATNRLGVPSRGVEWRLTLAGDKAALSNVNLALGYKADVD